MMTGLEKERNTVLVQLGWIVRAALLGAVIGPCCFLLSYLVGFSQTVRSEHWYLVFALPPAALFISWLFNKVDPLLRESSGTTMDLINWNIRQRTNPSENPDAPQKKISPWLAPIVLASTFIGHLAGASAGKEGAGVQIGTSISALFAKHDERIFKKKNSEIGIWLVIGSGAAFGALFKAPIAGTLFGIMVASPNIARFDAMLPCLVGSLVASEVASLCGIGTPVITGVVSIPWNWTNIGYALILGVASGVLARLFFISNHGFKKFFERILPKPYIRVLVCSGLLLACFLVILAVSGSTEYCGLSISLLNDSKPWSFVLKLLLTSLTIACGFTGGEVVPTMVIGASAFRTLGAFIGLPLPTLAVFGAIGMLSGTTNLPLVCFVLGLELFGFQNAEFLFIICVVSFIVSGRDSIYPHQLELQKELAREL